MRRLWSHGRAAMGESGDATGGGAGGAERGGMPDDETPTLESRDWLVAARGQQTRWTSRTRVASSHVCTNHYSPVPGCERIQRVRILPRLAKTRKLGRAGDALGQREPLGAAIVALEARRLSYGFRLDFSRPSTVR